MLKQLASYLLSLCIAGLTLGVFHSHNHSAEQHSTEVHDDLHTHDAGHDHTGHDDEPSDDASSGDSHEETSCETCKLLAALHLVAPASGLSSEPIAVKPIGAVTRAVQPVSKQHLVSRSLRAPPEKQ
jgi:hypothetical protein